MITCEIYIVLNDFLNNYQICWFFNFAVSYSSCTAGILKPYQPIFFFKERNKTSVSNSETRLIKILTKKVLNRTKNLITKCQNRNYFATVTCIKDHSWTMLKLLSAPLISLVNMLVACHLSWSFSSRYIPIILNN